MNKKALTETDVRTKFITPAILGVAGSKWNVMTQVREEVNFTKGRVIVRGKTVKRGEAKKTTQIAVSTRHWCRHCPTLTLKLKSPRATSRATAAIFLSALVAELTTH